MQRDRQRAAAEWRNDAPALRQQWKGRAAPPPGTALARPPPAARLAGVKADAGRAGEVDEVQAAVRAQAGHVVDAVHDDGEHRVAAAAARVHLGLCDRAVARAQRHHRQHLLAARHRHLPRARALPGSG